MSLGISAAGWAAIGAVGSVAVASDASRKSANAQRDAANQANNLAQSQTDQSRIDFQPWRDAGTTALSQLTADLAPRGDFNRDFSLADFNADPGYSFRRDQGMRGIEASAAARGGLLNGGTLKALDRYNQDYASGEYQNAYNRFNNDRTQRFNRLAAVAGIGQTATRDVANMGTQNAQTVGNNIMQGANARASGYVGQANALTGGINTLGNWFMYQNALNNNPYTQPGMGGYANPSGGGYSWAQPQTSSTLGGLYSDTGYGG